MVAIKPHLDYAAQITKLKKRGMNFDDLDEKQAIKKLSNVGYYRLSGYWYPFRTLKIPAPLDKNESRREETFRPNTSFSLIYKHYLFDLKLRHIIFNGIERVETYLKAKFAYELGKLSPICYKDKNLIQHHHTKNHDAWLDKLDSYIDRNKDKDCISWHMTKYGEIPIWVIVEVWDFGLLSKFYGMLEDKYKHQICKSIGFNNPNSKDVRDGLKTALEHLNIIRNKCAHHSRLWNTDLSSSRISIHVLDNLDTNKLKLRADSHELERIAGIVFLLWSLNLRISDHSKWLEDLAEHIESYSKIVSLSSMGFDNGKLTKLNILLGKN